MITCFLSFEVDDYNGDKGLGNVGTINEGSGENHKMGHVGKEIGEVPLWSFFSLC